MLWVGCCSIREDNREKISPPYHPFFHYCLYDRPDANAHCAINRDYHSCCPTITQHNTHRNTYSINGSAARRPCIGRASLFRHLLARRPFCCSGLCGGRSFGARFLGCFVCTGNGDRKSSACFYKLPRKRNQAILQFGWFATACLRWQGSIFDGCCPLGYSEQQRPYLLGRFT